MYQTSKSYRLRSFFRYRYRTAFFLNIDIVSDSSLVRYPTLPGVPPITCGGGEGHRRHRVTASPRMERLWKVLFVGLPQNSVLFLLHVRGCYFREGLRHIQVFFSAWQQNMAAQQIVVTPFSHFFLSQSTLIVCDYTDTAVVISQSQ